MIKRIALMCLFAFVLDFSLSPVQAANSDTMLVDKMISRIENPGDIDFLFDVQETLKGAQELCDDLRLQISFFSKIWMEKVKNKPFEEFGIGKLLNGVNGIKRDLNKLIEKSVYDPKDMVPLKEKLDDIKKVVNLYKRSKQKEAANSKLNYYFVNPLGFLAKGSIFIVGYPLSWIVGTVGQRLLKVAGKGAERVVSLSTTFFLFLSLAGVINGLYLSDSFVDGFVVPFMCLWKFILNFFIELSPEETAEVINESWHRYIIYHTTTKSVAAIDWALSFLPWSSVAAAGATVA